MNTAARALAHGTLSRDNFLITALSLQNLFLSLLMVLVLLSAFSVVYVKDLNRRLFSELQSLQETRDELHVEWSQLLLEQNTWATSERVQKIAEANIGMVQPTSQSIVILKP